MNNGTLRALVFDFDGTLAEPSIDFAAMKRDLAALVRRFAPEAPDAGVVPALEWLETVADELSRTDADAARIMTRAAHARIREIEAEAAARTSLFPFTRAMLAEFASLGVSTAIITRNCADAVLAVFPDAHETVGAVLTRDDVQRVKPDPEHLGYALERLGVSPAAALMVGDHPLDVETGKRAGTMTAGVLTGGYGRELLVAAGADFVVEDCGGLRRALAEAGLLP